MLLDKARRHLVPIGGLSSQLQSPLEQGYTGSAHFSETAGRLLGVTSRTARRLLHTLAEEGLAWPLPPSRTPQPGRPRQFYRLVTEKLENNAQP